MNHSSPAPNRLTILEFPVEEATTAFAQDVSSGLTSVPKQLSPKYFYDDLGSRLFEAICFLPEYYITRDEEEIVLTNSNQILAEVGLPPRNKVNLIELGSGSSLKTRHLIEGLLARETFLSYLPIDISLPSLEASTDGLLRKYPNLTITAFATEYFTALADIAKRGLTKDGSRNLVIFLGSSIGNLDLTERHSLLRAVHAVLNPGDRLLIGADLKKSTEVLLPAYNDALGITAAFNLNLLLRINREFDGDFDLSKFEHRALYNHEFDRIEMHVVSRQTQVVRIKTLSLKLEFSEGESIHTENSYKFELGALSKLATATGFRLTETWFDTHRRFSLNCLTVN